MSCRYPGVPCWWADQTDKAAVHLRRYRSSEAEGGACEGEGPWGYHNASTERIDTAPVIWQGEGWERSYSVTYEEPPHDDPRWPTTCDFCDYEFVEEDYWQVSSDIIYRRLDNGEEVLLVGEHGSRGSGPPGMLFEMHWGFNSKPGPDGLIIGAVCPNGAIWGVDAPATGGGVWTREGVAKADPPTVTAQPSIVAGDYHGFLQNGAFTDDLGG